MKTACGTMMKSIKITTLAFLTSIFFLLCFSSTILSASFKKIVLPENATGPEALAFKPGTRNFFTGIADGRILKYMGPIDGFVDVGTAAPNRSKSICDGIGAANPNPVCGRVLGLALYLKTNELYFCDAFYGLGVLRLKDGSVKILSTAAEGKRYRLCDGLDVDQLNGDVYFTDASSNYDLRQLEEAVLANDSTGRLLKYDIKKNQVTVLYRNLSGPGGVAIDTTSTFVIVSEYITSRTIKIWLRQPNTNKTKLISSAAMPDNIKRTASGNFWLAAAKVKPGTQSPVPIGQKIDAFGAAVRETLNFEEFYENETISEVQEYGGELYLGSMTAHYITVLKP